MKSFDSDYWCSSAMPNIWPEVLEIREAAEFLGLQCLSGIANIEPLEMALTFYNDNYCIGCASWIDDGTGWSWWLDGSGKADDSGSYDLITDLFRMSNILKGNGNETS